MDVIEHREAQRTMDEDVPVWRKVAEDAIRGNGRVSVGGCGICLQNGLFQIDRLWRGYVALREENEGLKRENDRLRESAQTVSLEARV